MKKQIENNKEIKKYIGKTALCASLCLAMTASFSNVVGAESISSKIAQTLNDIKKIFKDVNDSDWYYEVTKYVQEKGIFKGDGEGKFNPKSNITRAEMLSLLHNIKTNDKDLEKISGQLNLNGKWYKEIFEWGVKNKLADDKNRVMFYGAENDLTRQEVFDMMYQFAKNESLVDTEVDNEILVRFEDKDELSKESKIAAAWLVNRGIIEGELIDNKGYIKPNANITRAEIAAIMKRFNEVKENVANKVLSRKRVPNAETVEIKKEDNSLIFEIQGNPTTGYTWSPQNYAEQIIKVEKLDFIPAEGDGEIVGAGGTFRFKVSGVKKGKTLLSFIYLREFEGMNSAIEEVNYEISVDDNDEISYTKK